MLRHRPLKPFACAVIFIVAGFIKLNAQECKSCDEVYKIANYDFNMQIPAPDLNNLQGNEWLVYKTLFYLGKHAQGHLKNDPCVSFYLPPVHWNPESPADTDALEIPPLVDENENNFKVGDTYTLLPPESGQIPEWEGYIITGNVTGGLNIQSTLEIQVQTACSREVVAAASISFMPSYSSEEMRQVAYKAAEKIMPLSAHISKYENEKRLRDPSLTLHVMPSATIEVIPQKKMLKTGESTQVSLEMKDCDGHALAGREILFNETEFGGLKIFGTQGGSITPAKVITNEEGKAIVKFTLKPGAKEAIINAHSPGLDVKGCPSMIIGDAAINIKYTYSGYIKYKLDYNANCESDTTTGCMRHIYKHGERQGINYTASFYQEAEKGTNLEVSFTNRDDEDDAGSDIPNNMQSATYHHYKNELRHNILVCPSATKEKTSIQKINSKVDGSLEYGSVRFSNSESLSNIDIDLHFDVKNESSFFQTYLQPAHNIENEKFSWNAGFYSTIDKDFKVIKTRTPVGDRYMVTIKRNVSTKCTSANETVEMVINEN